jgi:uncharacterized OsmC-like protein
MTAPAATIRNYRVDAQSTDVFGRVLCSARDHHFIVDGPVQNGCPGEELTPPELFLSAVASCGVELVHVIARDQGATVGKVTLAVQGTVDRGNQKRADVTVFNSLRLDFIVAGADGATAAQLVEGFKRR